MTQSLELTVCEHKPSQQPAGPVIQPVYSINPIYADFDCLRQVWEAANHMQPPERVGFMGRRKYIHFAAPGLEWLTPTHWGPEGWYDATLPQFNQYRRWLSEWYGEEPIELLAQYDILVTPPYNVSDKGGIIMDFATSRSHADAFALSRCLRGHNVSTHSNVIYPYIFVTRWSVFNRFMEFASQVAGALEPVCKGEDSTNEAYKRRPMAYVLERAFSLWLESSGLSYKELPIVNCWEI